jgi:hypothetical protein
MTAQEPDYANGKGRIVPYNEVPILSKVLDGLSSVLGENELVVEGNYYYDITKCGIGFHGDATIISIMTDYI